MQEGLLWQPDRVEELALQIRHAAGAFENKFGVKANCCHVHPGRLPGVEKGEAGGVTVVADPYVLPNELWIGVYEEEECEPRACPGPE